jgi:hypothetical protein
VEKNELSELDRARYSPANGLTEDTSSCGVQAMMRLLLYLPLSSSHGLE